MTCVASQNIDSTEVSEKRGLTLLGLWSCPCRKVAANLGSGEFVKCFARKFSVLHRPAMTETQGQMVVPF